MAGTALTTTILTTLLKPIISDLYSGAKDQAKKGLSKWATEAGIKNIALTLLELDKAKTIWYGEDEIPLSDFYYPSRIEDRNKRIQINTIHDLPQGNLVIEGIVGQGKSIFMRHLAASTVAMRPPSIIPIFVELRTISSKRSLIDSIALFLNSISIKYSQETLDYLASSGKVILLLDGFDEIPSECVTDTIVELNVFHRKYPNLQIIVSSRPRSHIQNAPGFKVVKLVPLYQKDYDPFVSKLISSPVKRHDVISALDDCTGSIKGVIHTPLMLTLVVMIYQTEKEIPSTLSDFFDKLFGVVFTRHDKLKAGFNRQHHSGLSENRLKRLFEAFCFMTIKSGVGRTMNSAKFDKAFNDAVVYTKEKTCENEAFRKDIIKVACLMLEEGIDTITFLHKSILDYHAAAFVRDLPDTQAKTFYTSALKKFNQWEHVLQFLKAIDPVRFARDYTLQYLPEALEDLSSLIEKQNSIELIQFLEKLFPGATLEIDQKGKQEFTRPSTSLNELFAEIGDNIARPIFDLCNAPSPDKLLAAANLSGSNTLDPNSSRILNIRSIITVFGDDPIWARLKTIKTAHITTLESATDCINNEIRTDDLLEQLLTQD